MDNELLRQIIKEILEEEFLEEISTTGGASGGLGPPMVPHAFAGKGKKKSVGWRGKEFGVKSMPNPDDRKTNAVDEDNPADLTEGITIKEQPSSMSHIAFPISKEIKEFSKSVENYKNSEQEKFVNNIKGKLAGKSVKFIAKKDSLDAPYKVYTGAIFDVEGVFHKDKFYLILLSKTGKFFMSSDINKKMLIYGEEDAPVTQRVQNKPTQNPQSQNMVKI